MRRETSANAATCGPAAGSCQSARAAQHAGLAVRAPDGAVGPAERLPERRQHAGAQLVGLEAGRDVVGDRLLGEQQLVGLVALRRAPRAAGEDRARARRGAARVGREDGVGPEALHEGREVAGPHGRDGGDEGELRVRDADERVRLARGHRVGALAAVDDDVPAAPRQGGAEARRYPRRRTRARATSPQPSSASAISSRRDRVHVDEQRSEGTGHPHTSVIGVPRESLDPRAPRTVRPRGAARRAARARPPPAGRSLDVRGDAPRAAAPRPRSRRASWR